MTGVATQRLPSRWITAADAIDTVPADVSALGIHVDRCNGSRSRWFALSCTADALHGFVAGRFVTTLLIAGTAIGLAVVTF